jgi:hypothetical protein
MPSRDLLGAEAMDPLARLFAEVGNVRALRRELPRLIG